MVYSVDTLDKEAIHVPHGTRRGSVRSGETNSCAWGADILMDKSDRRQDPRRKPAGTGDDGLMRQNREG